MATAGYGILALAACMAAVLPGAGAEVREVAMEGGVVVSITYPESVITGQAFTVAVLVENNGWEDKQDITMVFDGQAFASSEDMVVIDRISEGGAVGRTIEFVVAEATPGRYFLNIAYSQVLVRDNEVPQDPFATEIAMPVSIKPRPQVTTHISVPESIFADAEFPFEIELVSGDIDLHNLEVIITPPDDVEFRGETRHLFSGVERGRPVIISAQIITPQQEIGSQYGLPFGVTITYEDHMGQAVTESDTAVLIMRPRTFLELTGDGGIWVGSFFIAPYVSIGTLIGIPAGTILSLLLRRSHNRGK